MEDTTLIGRGGAGRGQGRKPIAPDAKPYKLLLPPDQRAMLDQLGGAEWLRTQLAFAIHLDHINLEKAVNLSARYVKAMRQLPQFILNQDRRGPLTDVRTGARILPLGDLDDEADDSGLLQISYPGGHSIEVAGSYYFDIALVEASTIEMRSKPEEYGKVGILGFRKDPIHECVKHLREHLTRKHGLE